MFHGEWLNADVHPVYTKAVSAVMGAFGIGAAGLAAWMIWKIAARGTMPAAGAVAVLCAVSIVAGFCLITAHRLLTKTPRDYRSPLSASGWTILGVVFLVMGASLALAAFNSQSYEPLRGTLYAIVLAIGCFFARAQVQSRTKRSSGRSKTRAAER
jgi:hypothetical protein